jgi:hypothetical protein
MSHTSYLRGVPAVVADSVMTTATALGIIKGRQLSKSS